MCLYRFRAAQRSSFIGRYDTLVAEGQKLTPPPPLTGKRGRPRLGPPDALLARLLGYREDVRSYLSSARKHGQHNLAVLRDLFAGEPWIPAPAASP